jgi:hypothetical protein
VLLHSGTAGLSPLTENGAHVRIARPAYSRSDLARTCRGTHRAL